jgi:hypothetical protein
MRAAPDWSKIAARRDWQAADRVLGIERDVKRA